MICGGHVSCILELSCMWTVVWPNGQMVECWHLTSMEEDIAIFRRYIAEISCIEGFRHDISWRNIGSAIFWYFSREIGDLAINRLFLAIYRVVNAGQTRYSAPSTRYSARATVPPFLGAERIWTPNQKVWGSSTYHWAKLPFDIYYATTIYILKFII